MDKQKILDLGSFVAEQMSYLIIYKPGNVQGLNSPRHRGG